MNKSYNDHGFSLVEIMVALAIVTVISAIAAPSFLTWKENYKLKGVAREINSVFQQVRMEAIKRNRTISVSFTQDSYTIFIDDGEGIGGISGDAIQNGDEVTLRSGIVADGVVINASNLPANSTGYTSKGMTIRGRTGDITITGEYTSRRFKVTLLSSGHSRIETF